MVAPVKPLAERAEEFLSRAHQRHGNRFDYSQVRYRGTRIAVLITCQEHGEFSTTPRTHLHSKAAGCPSCLHDLKSENSRFRLQSLTTEQFVKRARSVHGDKYRYDAVRYRRGSSKVVIFCLNHGPFHLAAEKHLTGQGCRRCAFEKLRSDRRLPLWIVVVRALQAHGIGRYDQYDFRGYVNQYSKLRIHCPQHGWFRQTATNHWKGHGCPKCCDSSGERNVRKALRKLGIGFVEQYRFDDCRDKRPLPFDFYLPHHRVLIEYDGGQHFERSTLWGGQKGLEQTRRRDAIRDCFAAEKGFRLIRIPNWDFDRIEAILTEKLGSMSFLQQKRVLAPCHS